jgi:hypothetical protein
MEHNKKLLIIANKNSITYKEIFPLIKENKLWMGARAFSGGMWFVADYMGKYEKVVDGVKLINVPAIWLTNLDHGRRHQHLPLMTTAENLRFSKHKGIKGKAKYDRYDNYDAIEVPFTDAIPSDFKGVMGVPITFLDKYNPDQFEILGTSDNGLVDDEFKRTLGITKQFVDDYYKAGGTGAYNEGNPTAAFYENGVAKMAYKRIFIRHREK